MLTIGDKFPEFNLLSFTDLPINQVNIDNAFKVITESSYPDKWKLVFFYPKDFTFVCPTEIIAFSNMNDEFKKRNTQILACSIDSEFVHWAWRQYKPELNNISFPLLSDIKRELANALGILDKNASVTQRALFIINPENIIKFSMVTDLNVGRNPQEALRILDALQTGGICQCGWTKGAKSIDLNNIKI